MYKIFLQELRHAFLENWQGFADQLPRYVLVIVILTIGMLLASAIAKTFRKKVARRSYDPVMTNFLTKAGISMPANIQEIKLHRSQGEMPLYLRRQD